MRCNHLLFKKIIYTISTFHPANEELGLYLFPADVSYNHTCLEVESL